MKELGMNLPPFTRDSSGAASALFELGGLIVLHGPDGCIGNFTGYDEPRWYGSGSAVLYSALRELDAITGNDEKLIRRITAAARETAPAFICILGTPVPMLIGTDFAGIAADVEQRTGIPCFGFATTGFNLYDAGASQAYLAVLRRFCRPAPRQAGTINIIGANAIDFCTGKAIKTLQEMCGDRGYRINAALAMGCSLEDVRTMAGAAANLVVSASGLRAAQYMKEAFGIPWLAGLPVGHKAADRLFLALEGLIRESAVATGKAAGAGETGAAEAGEAAGVGTAGAGARAADDGEKQVLILGEAVASNALRDYLIYDRGMKGVRVGVLFSAPPELLAPGDLPARDEQEISRLVNDEAYHTIFADPLIKTLLRPDRQPRFVELPCVAVSSKLYWNNHVNIVGANIDKLDI